MRHRYIGGAFLAAAAVLAWPAAANAQPPLSTGTAPITSGEDGGFQVAQNAAIPAHLPTGKAGDSGFYFGMEFVSLMQTRAIGNQTIARYGFYDLTGEVTGKPGSLVGGGAEAINPSMFKDKTFQPGARVEIGYRFDDGSRIFANWLQLYDAHYTIGASQIPPLYRTRPDLADTFVSSPVYSFNSFFGGAQGKVTGVPDTAVFGIWNAATQMDVKFTQRFEQAQFGGRVPMFMTDYSRVYGTGGFQFNWFFERFQWRTVSSDQAGNFTPQNVAFYTNTLSQRLYGPFLGCGHEIFVANQFSLSCDLTGGLLMDVDKKRVKYILGDRTVQSKWGEDGFRLVPNANIAFDLWWYPIEGVQMRIGYQAMTFYNTEYMLDPVGFNFGNISPAYRFKAFRLVHGFNAGIGFFF
jgi:hypothetical protein